MFIDLNFPVTIVPGNVPQQSRKGKGKQTQTQVPSIVFTPAQLAAIESRIDLLEYRPFVYCSPFIECDLIHEL